MNPFSGFLQPMNNRPLEGLATSQDLLRVVQGNKEMKQRKLENEQQNTRADKRLSMEQAYQDRKFSQDDQKQVEALLAEYQDAEDQGDPVRLSRAAQMLKRFGMDVGSKQQAPDLRAFTGERPLVSRPDLQAFTGQQAQETELSQEEFEQKLIDESGGLPERMESTASGAPGTTPEMKAYLKKQFPEQSEDTAPVDMGDVDSPEVKQAAAAEGGVVDLDQEDPTPLKIGEEQTAETAPAPRRLSSQLLPTVVSKGGKTLYESSGPSGRWTPMVASVFEPFLQHENPEIGSAAKRAQAMASKLIEVDGVAPKDAIKLGMDYLNGEANRVINLERTKLGTRPKWGGGVGTPGKFQALGPKEDRAESIKLYITEARGAVGKLNESDRLLAQAEALASSSDPALQRNAVDVLVQSRSGATVSERERARYDQLDGVIASARNTVSRWTGGPLDPSFVNKIKMVIAEQRRINAATREEVAADLEEAYAAQNEGKVDAPILQRRKAALGKTIRRSDDSTPVESREEDLY